MPFKLSYLNLNLALTLGYLNQALNNSALYFPPYQWLAFWAWWVEIESGLGMSRPRLLLYYPVRKQIFRGNDVRLVMAVHLWLRAETKPNERRTHITPERCKDLVQAGKKNLRALTLFNPVPCILVLLVLDVPSFLAAPPIKTWLESLPSVIVGALCKMKSEGLIW